MKNEIKRGTQEILSQNPSRSVQILGKGSERFDWKSALKNTGVWFGGGTLLTGIASGIILSMAAIGGDLTTPMVERVPYVAAASGLTFLLAALAVNSYRIYRG